MFGTRCLGHQGHYHPHGGCAEDSSACTTMKTESNKVTTSCGAGQGVKCAALPPPPAACKPVTQVVVYKVTIPPVATCQGLSCRAAVTTMGLQEHIIPSWPAQSCKQLHAAHVNGTGPNLPALQPGCVVFSCHKCQLLITSTHAR